MAASEDVRPGARRVQGTIAVALTVAVVVVSLVLAVTDDDRGAVASSGVDTTTSVRPTTSSSSDELDPMPLPIGAAVSSGSGLDRVRADGTLERIWDRPTAIAFAVDDFVVAQVADGVGLEHPPLRSNEVVVITADGPEELSQPGADLTLHDAGIVDGQPVALITAGSGATPDDRDERLVLVDLESGAWTDLGSTGGWESGVRQARVTADQIVSLLQIEARAFVLVRSLDGSVVWEGDEVVDRSIAVATTDTEVLELTTRFDGPSLTPHLAITHYDPSTGTPLASEDLVLTGRAADFAGGFCFVAEWVEGALLCDQSAGGPIWIDLSSGAVTSVEGVGDGIVTLPRGPWDAAESTDASAWGGHLTRLDDGGLRADGFDRWLRDNPTTSPEEAARTLVGVPTAATSTVVDGSTAMVTVTLDTVGDDSVSGTRYTLRFSIDGDVVISFVEGTWADRCARGADTESFAPRLCP